MKASKDDNNLSRKRTDSNANASSPVSENSNGETNGETTQDPHKFAASGNGIVTESSCDIIELDGSSLLTTGTEEFREDNAEQVNMTVERMQSAVGTLLECIGEVADREGLRKTPSRFTEAFLFLTRGYKINVHDVVNDALFSEDNDEMVIVKDIHISSLCEHHLLPFTGKIHIGYIPSGTVIGLSKLPRIAEIFSSRLQVQERLTKDVACAVMEILKPQGVAVLMECTHLCMVMRGVQKPGATTWTRCMLGCFKNSSEARDEFCNLVSMGG